MDITNKIDILIQDEISTGDVSTNTAKGHIDVVGGKCPDGQVYDRIKKVCIPKKNESSSIQKRKFFELGRKVQDELHKIRADYFKPKDKDFSKVAKTLKITKKEAIRAWNFFTWGDEALLPESSVVGATYISGNSNIAGSGQTRIWGVKRGIITDLSRKEPVTDEKDDPTETNILGRKGLKFDKKSGSYIPDFWFKKWSENE
jgi:hypothetical protein